MTLAWEGREGGQADVAAATFDELYDAHRQRAFRLALLLCSGERALAEASGHAPTRIRATAPTARFRDFTTCNC